MKSGINEAAIQGAISERTVALELTTKGYTVCWPEYPTRFDLIAVSPEGEAIKVQVKTGQWIKIQGRRVQYLRGDCRGYTLDEVDLFAVVRPDTGEIYWVPNDEDLGIAVFGVYRPCPIGK